jgi:hypothetical protein
MTGLTPEQEIRARALECAVTLLDLNAPDALDIAATMFAPYIESGALPETIAPLLPETKPGSLPVPRTPKLVT